MDVIFYHFLSKSRKKYNIVAQIIEHVVLTSDVMLLLYYSQKPLVSNKI
jgi:hypothetical protein